MIKAIIIDDEIHSRKILEMLLKEYCPDVQLLEQCKDAQTGLEAIRKFNPDLVFLDIEMPHMNGFEMLEQISTISFAVIFITGYDQYAIRAFRFNAIDYLLKPVEPKELIAAVHKIQTQTRKPEAEQLQLILKQIQGKEHPINKLAVPTLDGLELIPADELMWCDANDNYTHLYFKNKNRITTCRTLKEVEEQLQDFKLFIRIHHSHIVNMNEVIKYVRGEGGYVILSDGTSVNVSRSRKEILLKALQPDKH
jgi:two-component system LytT family response regulator